MLLGSYYGSVKAAKIYQEGYGNNSKLMLPAENLVRPLNLLGLLKKSDCEERLALDIGCGDGRHVQYLDEHGFRVHATDVGERAISLSRQRKYITEPVFHLLPLSSVANDAILQNKFDLVICWETIHWYGGRQVVLRQLETIKSLLKPTGNLIFTLVKEDDYRLNGSAIIDKKDCVHRIHVEERKGCLMYQEQFDGYMKLIQDAGLAVKYLGWYSWGRQQVNNSTLDFGSQGVFSMYAFGCGLA